MKLTKDKLPKFQIYTNHVFVPKQPPFSATIQFLASNKQLFTKEALVLPEDGIFQVPRHFSLAAEYHESFVFLKRLFHALYSDKYDWITLDYSNCEKIDLDASVCMDTLVDQFFRHINLCRHRRAPRKCLGLKPINFKKHEEVYKVLFSIGAFKNFSPIQAKFDDIIPFPLLKGDNSSPTLASDKEIETTKIVDYIVESLSSMNRSLTWQAEDNLSKVVGEALINAAEHSGHQYRYSIGYFQHTYDEIAKTLNAGTFNLVIFDFGNTIYEKFKSAEATGLEVVSQMKQLSQAYTAKSLFKTRKFEEETLWTLYSLQEGVTSVPDKQRGNGSIRFIESFFNLKGDNQHDNQSFLTIISGNTRITFDGQYPLIEVERGNQKQFYKMMTFNESGKIEDLPDEKYVNFTDHFFPGTMIVAKICITFNNIENDSATS
ncbi:MAG: hypothetical protein JSR97_03165 [Verrucomicrobia bacterium]|nr:hypothetical protein [Verrucomicrobiota bacterium]